MKFIQIAPDQLKLCPALDRILPDYEVLELTKNAKKADQKERREELEARWQALCGSIAELGVQEPLKVVQTGDHPSLEAALEKGAVQIVDGRHRWKAALQAKAKTVPCQLVSSRDATHAMDMGYAARRHMTKSQLAYAGVCLHPEVAQEGKARQAAQGTPPPAKNAGGVKGSETAPELTQPELAKAFGVSLRLVQDACALYREFSASKTLRKSYEHLIFAGVSFGALRAAMGGGESTKGQARPVNPGNIELPIKTLATWFKQVESFNSEQRAVALDTAASALAEQGEAMIEFLDEALTNARQLQAEA